MILGSPCKKCAKWPVHIHSDSNYFGKFCPCKCHIIKKSFISRRKKVIKSNVLIIIIFVHNKKPFFPRRKKGKKSKA